jgi:hypothetical protein
MKINKMVFWVLVLVSMISCVPAQQKENGEYQVSGQQVYTHTIDFSSGKAIVNLVKDTWNQDVGLEGVVIGSIKTGILNLTLPPLFVSEFDEEKVYNTLRLHQAFLALVNIDIKSIVRFKFTIDWSSGKKRWIFIDSKTERENTLENLYRLGYKWFGGQELPF